MMTVKQITPTVSTGKKKYSSEELAEFKTLILEKKNQCLADIKEFEKQIKTDYSGDALRSENGLDFQIAEDQKKQLIDATNRQKEMIAHLDRALLRIANGTYGICVKTGELIPAERLRIVPHTTHTVEAKNARDAAKK
ncbi:MAG: TraR/DksA C4-type zinc finger protein [Candidatus Pacebacteria bacterium]|nr:TraR/DksA C4-type zinc finger protein [Candidatus Paceibacterota bacterium]MCD8563585.1 TraR/DksA C4-type zinc finger protein [Candidatus Paceibacterota bacterium]